MNVYYDNLILERRKCVRKKDFPKLITMILTVSSRHTFTMYGQLFHFIFLEPNQFVNRITYLRDTVFSYIN